MSKIEAIKDGLNTIVANHGKAKTDPFFVEEFDEKRHVKSSHVQTMAFLDKIDSLLKDLPDTMTDEGKELEAVSQKLREALVVDKKEVVILPRSINEHLNELTDVVKEVNSFQSALSGETALKDKSFVIDKELDDLLATEAPAYEKFGKQQMTINLNNADLDDIM